MLSAEAQQVWLILEVTKRFAGHETHLRHLISSKPAHVGQLTMLAKAALLLTCLVTCGCTIQPLLTALQAACELSDCTASVRGAPSLYQALWG